MKKILQIPLSKYDRLVAIIDELVNDPVLSDWRIYDRYHHEALMDLISSFRGSIIRMLEVIDGKENK